MNYQKICSDLLKDLPSRTVSVIERRFGLTLQRGLGQEGKRETLEAIGASYGITRERVRQVENEAFSKLCQCEPSAGLKQAIDNLDKYLQKHGGLKREDILLFKEGDVTKNYKWAMQDFSRSGDLIEISFKTYY